MVKVIAEVGCNHKGDFDIALELIDSSVLCKCDIIKFQKRNPRELLSEEEYHKPHPVPENAYGKTYGEHRKFLEFSIDQHRKLKGHCEKRGILYSTSVWDMTSAQEIVTLNPKLIKIPSAQNTNFSMLGWLCENYMGEIHLSFGMTTHEEEREIIDFFEQRGRAKDIVIYSCTSGYPVAFEDICLLELIRLQQQYGSRVKSIGFSGHHLGIAVDIGAITLGAQWVERHFTLDRTWKGTDHAASLEPAGMAKLTRDIRNVGKALAIKQQEILPVEAVQRKKLKWKGASRHNDEFCSNAI